MSDDEFLKHRQSIIDLKMETPKTLRQEGGKYWAEIPLLTLDFDRDAADAKVLATLTKQDLASFWINYFVSTAHRRSGAC